jgi:hypothetical protein
MKISESLINAGKPLDYYPSMAKALKSVKATLFLCQLLYWQGKQENEEWICKSQVQVYTATGLSRAGQDTARRILRQAGIIEEKLTGVPATVHYKINLKNIINLLS